MEWNVFVYDVNKRRIVACNIFNHSRFKDDMQKLINSDVNDDEFKFKVRDLLMYYFRSRCEYEVMISDWIDEKYKMKIDVCDQVMMNFDKFVNYLLFEYKYAKESTNE